MPDEYVIAFTDDRKPWFTAREAGTSWSDLPSEAKVYTREDALALVGGNPLLVVVPKANAEEERRLAICLRKIR